MPTVCASASDTETLDAAKPKTAPNPTRASAFRRDIASGLAISFMSISKFGDQCSPKLTSPVLARVGPQAPDVELRPDESVTNALGQDLIELDIQVEDRLPIGYAQRLDENTVASGPA